LHGWQQRRQKNLEQGKNRGHTSRALKAFDALILPPGPAQEINPVGNNKHIAMAMKVHAA